MRVLPLLAPDVQQSIHLTPFPRAYCAGVKKKAPRARGPGAQGGGDLLSRPSRAVPSARAGLTALFGMGRGGAPPRWPPCQGLGTAAGARPPGRGKGGGRGGGSGRARPRRRRPSGARPAARGKPSGH